MSCCQPVRSPSFGKAFRAEFKVWLGRTMRFRKRLVGLATVLATVVIMTAGCGEESVAGEWARPAVTEFTVTVAPGSGVSSPAQLQEAAATVSARAEVAGMGVVDSIADDQQLRFVVRGEHQAADIEPLLAPGHLTFRKVEELAGRCGTASVEPQADMGGLVCDEGSKEQLRVAAASLTNSDIARAEPTPDASKSGNWSITIQFTSRGQNRWTTLTQEALGERVAIMVDDRVLASPVVQQVISGDAVIAGDFSRREAQTLSSYIARPPLEVVLVIDAVAVKD